VTFEGVFVSSISYKSLVESKFQELKVPEQTETLSTLETALLWIQNGFFVLPIRNETKHAGSVVGKGWPDKSSKDPDQIYAWFSNQNYGLALHVGKSGAIAFDVDNPDLVPYRLRQWLKQDSVPFQSTRTGDGFRGHYLFATLPGRNFGNSNGYLGTSWGEVRGENGIIVLSPTQHSKADQGGQYLWVRTGILPYLPSEIAEKLPRNSPAAVSSIDLAEVDKFFEANAAALMPELLERRLSSAKSKFVMGSRHNTARDLLFVCLRDAVSGLYPARDAVEQIAALFISHKPQIEWASRDEYIGMVRWAAAQVNAMSPDDISHHREVTRTQYSPEVTKWLGGHSC
jgi:hypothetical protein